MSEIAHITENLRLRDRLASHALAVGLALISLCTNADSQIGLSEPRTGRIAHTMVHYFLIRDYTPPIVVEPLRDDRRLASRTPEDAAKQHFGAVVAGNYKKWLALWDEPSRAELLQRNKEKGRDAGFWKDWWHSAFSQYRKFELTRRVETTDFVVIELHAFQAKERADYFLDVTVIETNDGQWRPTLKYAGDPVMMYWRTPDKVPTEVGRGVPKR